MAVRVRLVMVWLDHLRINCSIEASAYVHLHATIDVFEANILLRVHAPHMYSFDCLLFPLLPLTLSNPNASSSLTYTVWARRQIHFVL